MVWIPGGQFRMGSDKHYPEEAPAHDVVIDGFWMDRVPVTNLPFKEFVRATGFKTVAETPPDPKQYPGALPAGNILRQSGNSWLVTAISWTSPVAVCPDPQRRPARRSLQRYIYLQ